LRSAFGRFARRHASAKADTFLAYGLWLLVSLDSCVLIAIAVRFAIYRPRAIGMRAVR
jgi:hypothetical protein